MIADMTSDVFEVILWPAVELPADNQEFELEPFSLSDDGLPL